MNVPSEWYAWSENLSLSPFAVSYLLALVKGDDPEPWEVSMQIELTMQLKQLKQAKES